MITPNSTQFKVPGQGSIRMKHHKLHSKVIDKKTVGQC